MITYFEIRLLKFIVYSLYGYLEEWSKRMYDDGLSHEYEESTDEDIMDFCRTGEKYQYDPILRTAKEWVL